MVEAIDVIHIQMKKLFNCYSDFENPFCTSREKMRLNFSSYVRYAYF